MTKTLKPLASGPFVPINIGGMPENLLESELFGYEKGAFTGASSPKPGMVELACGGTLFLDEIGDMPPALQVKLLRFLQDKKIQHLGGISLIKVNGSIGASQAVAISFIFSYLLTWYFANRVHPMPWNLMISSKKSIKSQKICL